MSTEILLMRDVSELGSEGDVVTVADGYARNFLFPRKLAAPVTEATRRRLAKLRREREEDLKARLEGCRRLADRLAGISCTIAVKAGEDEKLYGSVTAADIVDSLKQQGVEIDRHAVALEHPLKELGVFDVKINLHPQVEATVKVWVVEE